MADHSQHANASGQGATLVQILGDNNVVTLGPGEAVLYLQTYAADLRARVARRPEGEGDAPGYTATGLAEADLLVPFTRSIELVGRATETTAAAHWLDQAAPLSIRVMTGAGGRGKTRFALELAGARRALGWEAGFVVADRLATFLAQPTAPRFAWGKPTLVMIDYAAGKAETVLRWLRLLLGHPGCQPGSTAPRLRLLLLERDATRGAGWWEKAFGGSDHEGRAIGHLIDSASPVQLGPIDRPADRRAVFATAFRLASNAEPVLGDGIDERMAAQSWGGEPLFLAIAGIYAARLGVAEAVALPADALALAVAADELLRIRKVWVAKGRPAEADDFAVHMAALATLCGGLSRADAETAIRRERDALDCGSIGDTPRVRDAMADALRGPQGGIAPIQPDILGEAAMILAWKETSVAEAAITRALPTHRAPVVLAVIGAAQDFAIHGRQAPVAWLRAVLEATSERSDLEALANALPHATVELREAAVAINEKLLTLPPAHAGDEAWRALTLNNLSTHLSGLGRREAALAASEEAVAIRRRLAAARPDEFLPDLAASLNNLSADLSRLGRLEAALAAIEEAVAIRRRLAAARPDEFLPDLARSLNNLSNGLSDLGRREEALAAIEESVAIRRRLAAARPDAFLPGLAMSLNNLSVDLNGAGRREEALAAIEEAVAIRRSLAAARPDAFLPDLAISLNNLAAHLSSLGRREAALAASKEAVATYRRLAAERPDAFLPDLAGSLNNLSTHLSSLGRREAALAASKEAVATYRRLAAARPDAFLPDLALSLNNLSNRLGDLGRREAALAAIEEAVATYRRLAAARPDAFLPDLAMSLNNLSNHLSALGRREEALAAIEDSVAIRRRLAAARPEVFSGDLGKSLALRAGLHSDAGDAAAARQDAVEALGLLEPLVAAGWADMVPFRDHAVRIRDAT